MIDRSRVTPEALAPQRDPGLIRRVWAAIAKSDPKMGPQPEAKQTTRSGVVGTSANQWFDNIFISANDRFSVYHDAEEMDDNSEETSVALDTLADNATSSEDGTVTSFIAKAQTKRVQDVLDNTTEVCGLHKKAYQLARNALKYGDLWAEVVVSQEDIQIVDIRFLPPSSMYRNEDRQGLLRMADTRYSAGGQCQNDPGECAFEQRDVDLQTILATFYPWQIIHGRWNWNGTSPYGRSYLFVGRVIWKKLKAMEESLIIARLTRAFLKLVFYVDTSGLSMAEKTQALNKFRNEMTRKSDQSGTRENAFSVFTDIYLSAESIRMGQQIADSKTKVEAIDPKNEGLQVVSDIEHLHRKLLAVLRVPPAYYGFEKDINAKNTLGMQDIQFVRVLRRIQQFLSEVLKQVFDTQLVLEGIDPKASSSAYDIRWPTLSVENEQNRAAALLALAQAAALLLGTNAQNQTPVVTPEYVLRHMLELDDDLVAEVLAELDKQEQEDQAEKEQQMAAQQKMLAMRSAQAAADGEPSPPSPTAGPRQPNAPKDKSQAEPEPPGSARAKQGANTAVRQEVEYMAREIAERLDEIVGPDFVRVAAVQEASLEAARLLTDRLDVLVGANGHLDEQ